jgi:hypothetical protein
MFSGVNRVRSNNTHSQRNFSGGNPTNHGIGSSRPETPLKHLVDGAFPVAVGTISPSMPAPAMPSAEYLLDQPSPDLVMAAWLQQMEKTPISLPPKNTQTLPASIFVSYDFICWLMRSVATLNLLEDAILFANRLVLEDRIRLLATPSDSEYGNLYSIK